MGRPKGQPANLTCEACGAPVNYHPAGQMRFCSRACANRANVAPLKDRFWRNVFDRGNHECWDWTGLRDRDGYGRMRVGGKRQRAHRIALFLESGEWPRGVVRHICDRPACVNPNHLRIGTQAENIQDAWDRKRRWNRRFLLTEDIVLRIRQRYAAGGVSWGQIAREMGLKTHTVYSAGRGLTWSRL